MTKRLDRNGGNNANTIEELINLLTVQLRNHENIDNVNNTKRHHTTSLSNNTDNVIISNQQTNNEVVANDVPSFQIEFPDDIKYIIMNIGNSTYSHYYHNY